MAFPMGGVSPQELLRLISAGNDPGASAASLSVVIENKGI